MVNFDGMDRRWRPPENRPNTMEEWGGMTPEFIVHDVVTSPAVRQILQELDQVRQLVSTKYPGVSTALWVEHSQQTQEYVVTMSLRYEQESPYELSVGIPEVVTRQMRRDALAEWVVDYLQQLNDWLELEGLQLPGEEVKLLEGTDETGSNTTR